MYMRAKVRLTSTMLRLANRATHASACYHATHMTMSKSTVQEVRADVLGDGQHRVFDRGKIVLPFVSEWYLHWLMKSSRVYADDIVLRVHSKRLTKFVIFVFQSTADDTKTMSHVNASEMDFAGPAGRSLEMKDKIPVSWGDELVARR